MTADKANRPVGTPPNSAGAALDSDIPRAKLGAWIALCDKLVSALHADGAKDHDVVIVLLTAVSEAVLANAGTEADAVYLMQVAFRGRARLQQRTAEEGRKEPEEPR